VDHEVGVDFTCNEEMSRSRCRFDVPFEVVLIHPRPRADFGAIGCLTAIKVQESTNLALNGQSRALSVMSPVGRSSGVSPSVSGGVEPPF